MPHIFCAWTSLHVYFRNFGACTSVTPKGHLQPSIVLRRGQPETAVQCIGAEMKEDDCEVRAGLKGVRELRLRNKASFNETLCKGSSWYSKNPYTHHRKKKKCTEYGASCTACIMMFTTENRSKLNFLEF